MNVNDSKRFPHDTPYSTSDVIGALLLGGRPLLYIGHHPQLTEQADALGCPVVALVADPECEHRFSAAGHEVHRVDLDDPEALGLLGLRLFDQIAVSSAVDMMSDPVGLLRRLSKHLTAEGRLVVGVRNSAHVNSALAVLLGRSLSPTSGDRTDRPVHLYDWAGVERLLGGAGLSVNDVIEVHRRPSLEVMRDDGLPAEALATLVRHGSTVSEWVISAGLIPHDGPRTLTRRLLQDAVEQAEVINDASVYARSLEERLKALEASSRMEVDLLAAEVVALHKALDDAVRLEREVEWQRNLIGLMGARLDAAERRMPEVESAYASAMAHAAATQSELAVTRQRVGFVLMDRIAQKVFRHPVLVMIMVEPLRAFMQRRSSDGQEQPG